MFHRPDPSRTPAPSATPAAPAPAGTGAGPGTGPGELYAAHDPIPSPEALEKSTETAWALFQELNHTQERRFSETLPMTAHAMPLPTLPMPPIPTPAAAGAPLLAGPLVEPTLDDLLLEARRNNRICPQQAGWRALYALLPGKRRSASGWEPPLPNTGPGWATTSVMAKRLALRDHLQWAVDHGGAATVLDFMQRLPEAAWLHVGEDGA